MGGHGGDRSAGAKARPYSWVRRGLVQKLADRRIGSGQAWGISKITMLAPYARARRRHGIILARPSVRMGQWD